MLSPEEFREEHPPEDLEEELPDSPIASLRDVQYLYGKLYTLATAGGGRYAPYLTPDAAGDLIDTNDSLIVVRVDLSGDEPRLADDERGPVWVTRYTDERVETVAHSKFSAAAGIDHSITHQSGANSDPEKLARYATERLTRWATDDVVRATSEDHEQGWIIEDLSALGEDEEALEAIDRAVHDKLGGESTTALLTVQVKLERDGDYLLPADVDVFMEAMRERKLSKLVTKNKADDSSGDATDLVTGQPARTVGTSEDPQNYYLGKQLEKFPGLDIEEAWRTHPISEDSAVTVMNAGTFVEACTYSTFGARVYYLPYFFGRTSVDDAYDQYDLLHRATVEADEDDEMTTVELAYDQFGNRTDVEPNLRFYVSAVMPHQMSRYDVFGETLNGRLLYPRHLANRHNQLIRESSAFNSRTDWTAPLPTHDSWSLLTPDDNRLHSISTGWYFRQTFASRDDTDADADDPRIEALVNVLSGEPIAVETLLAEYVERIVSEENDADLDQFPSFRVAGQFAQLCTLADPDLQLLRTDDPGKKPITEDPTRAMETRDEILADGGDASAEKLESFVTDTPALAPGPGPINDQRRGAFLLGVLVGEVGSYQGYSEGRSTTLIDQFPVKSISKTRVKKVTQETIGKTITYTRDSGRTITLFEHVVESLRETILQRDPEDWEIDTDDLRFYYALGVTYGMNDHPDWDTVETDETEEAIQ